MTVRSALVQTLWADVIACTLRDAGVALCVISPGSRSTPLVAALDRARDARLELVTIIDERAAAFYALGAARATARPVALVCTSGSAAAHYLPAIVEAAHAGVPLIAITADRPPELHDCGASQTIDQHALYGGFVRAAFELGAPAGEPLAMRAARRKVVQAIGHALGPDPGPVHINAAFRKPLEPTVASTPDEHALATAVHDLCAQRPLVAPPRLAPNPSAISTLARAIAAEPRGLIVAGAMPVTFGRSREAVFELARRSGYPIVAEAGSQLRFGPRPDDIVFVDGFDLIADAPTPSLIVQLGSEPVAASWPAFVARAPTRWVLAGARWSDPDSAAEGVILGEVPHAIDAVVHALAALLAPASPDAGRASSRRMIERAAATVSWLGDWQHADRAAARALELALDTYADSEVAALRAAIAALPATAQLQLGNSLPIRIVDHATVRAVDASGTLDVTASLTRGNDDIATDLRAGSAIARPVLTQRGAAGIDGLVASAAGATRAAPVLLVLGDVSFAHDIGGLLATRAAPAALAILVIDNGGGQIFGGLPIGSATSSESLERHWLTPPSVDIPAVAAALGARAVIATTPSAIARAVAAATTTPGVTVIHAPVTATGARDVRRAALATAKAASVSSASVNAVSNAGSANANATLTTTSSPSLAPTTLDASRTPATSTPVASSTNATASVFIEPYEIHTRERRLDELRETAIAAWRAATPIPL